MLINAINTRNARKHIKGTARPTVKSFSQCANGRVCEKDDEDGLLQLHSTTDNIVT